MGRPMTVAEAAQVWCPWSIGVIPAQGGSGSKTANRHPNGEFPEGCACLNVLCAAWVFVDPADPGKNPKTRRGACGNVRGFS